MQIIVKLGEPLWREFGTRRLKLEFAENHVTVAQALTMLARHNLELNGDLRPDGLGVRDGLPYHLFVNHTKVSWDEIDQVALNDGDQLALFLLVVGG